MANNCINYVEFSGDAENLKNIFDYFSEFEKEITTTTCAVFKGDNIGVLSIDTFPEDNRIVFDSKWSPTIAGIWKLAIKYKVSYVHEYIEPGNRLCGMSTFENGEKQDFVLPENFYPIEDKENGGFLSVGEVYESEQDAAFDALNSYIGREKYSEHKFLLHDKSGRSAKPYQVDGKHIYENWDLNEYSEDGITLGVFLNDEDSYVYETNEIKINRI